ncbi:MAG: hypothetical protein PVH19_14630 [Planctomycetia bacterium]|jgi:hypothetical protein
MKLTIQKIIRKEICHYASPELLITSLYNRIFVEKEGQEQIIDLPKDKFWKRGLALSRLARRALRLDKCNVVPVADGLVILRQGKVYHFSEATQELTPTLDLKYCRNVLHQSILSLDGKELYFGEYGSNPNREEIPVYRSLNAGKSWETAFLFPAKKIRHIHGCYFDPFEEKIWVLTGDFKDECHILCTNKNFNDIEWIGNGQQVYRTCNLFFEEDAVHWIMDSQLENSYHIRLDRKTRKIEILQLFPGPVWYIKRLSDGYYLAGTANEIGEGVHDKYTHLMVSKDLETWEDAYLFRHDGLPKRFFKFGILSFADGPQSSDAFYVFMEGLRGFDGKIALCSLYE